MSNLPQMSGMPQVLMMVPTQKELNDAAEVKMQEVVAPNNIREIPAIGEVIAPIDGNALASNDIVRLSKNMKLRMAHRGFNEIEQTWETQDRFEEVAVGSTMVWKFVAKDPRPSLVMADTDSGLVLTNPGTFAESQVRDPSVVDPRPAYDYTYEGNASSSSANDGLIMPEILALAADQVLKRETILDEPGRTGGVAMDNENYMTQPGIPVVTSLTAKATLDTVLAMVGQVNTVTTAQLIAIGLPVNTIVAANLAGYRTAIQNADPLLVTDLQGIQQLLVDVNNP